MDHWKNRIAENSVSPEFLERVSTRAFDPNKDIHDDSLLSCFEAARWAPSSYNNQPWRYVYSKRGSSTFTKMLECLVDFNKQWCKNASVLVIICSKTHFSHNNKPSPTASLDTGSSYMSLVLQAQKLGICSHAMEGIYRDKIKETFNIPDDFKIEAMLAMGYQGMPGVLSKELQDKETPSTRKSLKEIVSCDHFNFV